MLVPVFDQASYGDGVYCTLSSQAFEKVKGFLGFLSFKEDMKDGKVINVEHLGSAQVLPPKFLVAEYVLGYEKVLFMCYFFDFLSIGNFMNSKVSN